MARPPASGAPSTILHVAAEAQVSKSTVSLVLQGSPRIPEATAERVRAAAARLGYVYNRRAAELRQRASNTIGVVINDLMNPFFAEVLVGLEQRLVEAGYTVLMGHSHEDPARQAQLLHSMREQNAAGLVLCPALGTPAALPRQLKAWGIPFTVIVRTLGGSGYDFAGSANTEGAALATQHLIGAGHRRIGFLGGVAGTLHGERLAGYRQALEAHRIGFDAALVLQAHPNRAGGHSMLNALLDRGTGATAAVCYNDITAFGALSALGARGLRAGEDFALTGFDNVLDAAHSNPPLSTVDIRPGELGAQAAALLLARIAEPGRPRQVYCAAPQLVLRQSG